MITGVGIIALVILLGVLSHRQSRFEERILKNVPLSDWFVGIIVPVLLYLGWFIIIRNISGRPSVDIFPLDDIDVLVLTILFIVYGFVGNGMHFTSKIIGRYLKAGKHDKVYKVTEMFHGKFSHYLTHLNGLFIGFMLAIFEINHPLVYPLSRNYLLAIVTLGVILGLSAKRSVFYTNEWFGGFNKPIFYVASLLDVVLFIILKIFNMKIVFYSVYFFITVTFTSFIGTFVFRQIYIFMRLSEKRKLGFLAKIFSF